MRLKEEIARKRPQMKKIKVLFHQDNAPNYKSIATIANLHELHFELLIHPPYSPDLAPSDYYLFADLKKMLQRKKFGSNVKVIAETESFYKKGIEMLKRCWNECITFEEDYVYEWSRILPKSRCCISHPTNLLSDVLISRNKLLFFSESIEHNIEEQNIEMNNLDDLLNFETVSPLHYTYKKHSINTLNYVIHNNSTNK